MVHVLTFQLWVNATSTGLLCNVTLTTQATGYTGLIPCSDLVDSVSVNAGDTVSVGISGQTRSNDSYKCNAELYQLLLEKLNL
jgi:hypothetical protein